MVNRGPEVRLLVGEGMGVSNDGTTQDKSLPSQDNTVQNMSVRSQDKRIKNADLIKSRAITAQAISVYLIIYFSLLNVRISWYVIRK